MYKDYVITFGGHDGVEYRNDIVVLDTRNLLGSCEIITSEELPYLRYHTACLYQNHKIVIFGGQTKEQKVSNSVIMLDIDDERGKTKIC